jgi:hypothetical protein
MSRSAPSPTRPPITKGSRRALTEFECRSWIGGRHEGRLGHQTGRGARTVVVNYAVTDSQLLFRLPEYNEICQYAPGREITMSVCSLSDNHTSTEVVVTGVGYLEDDRAHGAGSVDLTEHWPTGVSTHLMCLDLADVHGSTCSTGLNQS